jgi:4-hydroxybenzoyl-CoA reductase gamma subunit
MTEDTAQGTSRRTFIKGVVAAGAVASSSAYLFRTTAVHGQPGGAGTVERLVTLNVNGQDRRVDIMPQETLAMTLRYKLGLTGTKLGCDRAECGACTVLVDGAPRLACVTLAARCEGARIETIESLAEGGRMSALQAAFHEKLGTQCGFCTPGMILAAEALLRSDPAPDEAAIRTALAGNLCRCTGYVKIIEAVAAVSNARQP